MGANAWLPGPEAIDAPPSYLESSLSAVTRGTSSARALDDAAINRNRAGYDEAESARAAAASIASTHVDVFGCVGMGLLGIYAHD